MENIAVHHLFSQVYLIWMDFEPAQLRYIQPTRMCTVETLLFPFYNMETAVVWLF